MTACKTLVRTSLFSFETRILTLPNLPFISTTSPFLRSLNRNRCNTNRCSPLSTSAVSRATPTPSPPTITLQPPSDNDDSSKDTVAELLANKDDIARLMRMERRSEPTSLENRWFPYIDKFKSGSSYLTSSEVLEVLDPFILPTRKDRINKVVLNRSYSLCLVVEALTDFGNASAALRSADALGIQSVHVISRDTKRYRDNRHVSMGAEKWLDIELWDSPQECFNVLKARGYRIATTHVGIDVVSVYDMDWSCPTAIVVGNESSGISDEALELSDLHCSIPMKGMVESFNVSVAAGILMHHAVCDRTSRLGCHGDLTLVESQILRAEFCLRHSRNSISVVHEFTRRKVDTSFLA